MRQAIRAGTATALATGAVLAGMAILGLVGNFVPRISGDIGLWQFHILRSAVAMAGMFLIIGTGIVITRRSERPA